jgi:16S rRNA G966 N2-methylase RsmD
MSNNDGYRELFFDKQDQLLKALQKAISLQEELDNLEKFHSRAMKLLKKRKKFIVIAFDEPYFIEAYSLISEYEKSKGTWTDEDERIYQESVSGVSSI